MAAESPPGAKPIRFPVLSFSRDGLVLALDSLEPISRCTKLGFKNGFYNGLILVDSDRFRHRVAHARRVRTLPPTRLRDVLDLLTGNTRWQVEFIFDPGSTLVSLEEVKSLFSSSFKENAMEWEEMTDFERFRDQTMHASSMEEIFAAFRAANLV